MARGQTMTYPKRFVVFATPNGTRNSLFWPTGTETNFTLNTFTPDLDALQEQAHLPEGHQAEPVAAERRAGRDARVGARARHGRHADRRGRSSRGRSSRASATRRPGWGSGQSLDQYLAGKLAPNTTFPSMQLGVHVRDTEVRARISYAGADMPIPPREDPKDVFAPLFGMPTGGRGRPIRRWRGCGRSARACSTRPTPRRRGSRTSSAGPTATSWTPTWPRCATSRSGWSA